MVTTSQTIGAPVVERPMAEQPEIPEGTTRVVMLAHITGTRNGEDWPRPGGVIELPAQEAADLIRNQLAKPAPAPVERAVVEEPAERATVEEPAERAIDDNEPSEQAITSRAQSARPSRIGRSKGK